MSIHKKVRQLVAEKKSNIKDKEFFTSLVLRRHFEDIAYGITQKFGKEHVVVQLEWNADPQASIAYTDGLKVTINTGSDFLKDTDRNERYQLVYGLNSHELGHILYTDFTIINKMKENIILYHNFYPDIPKEAKKENEVSEIKNYLNDPTKASIINYFIHDLHNIVEDAHIENRLMYRYTGDVKRSLLVLRKRHFDEIPDVLANMAEEKKDEDILYTILQQLLSYAKFGEIKFGDADLSNERIQAVLSVTEEVDEYILTTDAFKRAQIGNLIFVKLWAYYKPMVDFLSKQSEQDRQYSQQRGSSSQGSGGIPMASNEQSSLGDTRDTSQTQKMKQSSSQSSSQDDESEDGSSSQSANRSKSQKSQKKDKSQSDDANEEQANNIQNSSSASQTDSDDEDGDQSSGNDTSEDNTDESDNSDKNTSDKVNDDSNSNNDESDSEETGDKEGSSDESADKGEADSDEPEDGDENNEEVPNGNNDESDEDCDTLKNNEDNADNNEGNPFAESDDSEETNTDTNSGEGAAEEIDGDGEFSYDNEYEGSSFDVKNAIDDLLEELAEEKANKTIETEIKADAEEIANSINYGNIHKRCSIILHRQVNVSDSLIETYQQISPKLLSIAKGLAKTVEQKLKDYQQGGKFTGLYFGRRIDKNNLIRTDGKIFYNNRLPQDLPQLCVGVLVDESISMKKNNRSIYARATATIIYEFCQRLHIPITIVGHSAEDDSYRKTTKMHFYDYCEFDSVDDRDKYRLMDIKTRGCTRDGAALRYIMERLARRPEEQKILFVISDGKPCSVGYSGNAAKADIQSIVKEYERKGVKTVACAIGADKKEILSIYGENRFLDITDLNELPRTMTKKIINSLKIS